MSTEKRRVRSDDEWRAILAELEAYPGTASDFAAKHGIVRSVLYKARKRLRKQMRKSSSTTASAPIDKRAKVLELHAQGMRQADIAKQLNLPVANVHYYVKRGAAHNGPAQSRTSDVKSAIMLLRQMEKEIMRLIRSNKIQAPDNAHLLGMSALRALAGDQ